IWAIEFPCLMEPLNEKTSGIRIFFFLRFPKIHPSIGVDGDYAVCPSGPVNCGLIPFEDIHEQDLCNGHAFNEIWRNRDPVHSEKWSYAPSKTRYASYTYTRTNYLVSWNISYNIKNRGGSLQARYRIGEQPIAGRTM